MPFKHRLNMTDKEIVQKVQNLRNKLAQSNFEENAIDLKLPVICPFRGSSETKLIILGQDPTVKNIESRRKIDVTLNLDKKNALRKYVVEICEYLNINIENVYATNLFKYFYTVPPANTLNVLEEHLTENLNILKDELKEFSSYVPIITLGQPVLQLLTSRETFVRNFWDYNKKTKLTNNHFSLCSAENNKLDKGFFPFPHQPSYIRKEFYKKKYKELFRVCEFFNEPSM